MSDAQIVKLVIGVVLGSLLLVGLIFGAVALWGWWMVS